MKARKYPKEKIEEELENERLLEEIDDWVETED